MAESELFEDDPRKSKDERRLEKKIELIELREHAVISGFPSTEKVWTVNKSDLIAKYLYGFLAVTRNGIYIDAFSGPQEEDDSAESWTAKKVLNMDSHFLKKAYLFEENPEQVRRIQVMADSFMDLKKRGNPKISITRGDSNKTIPDLFNEPEHQLRPRQAVLALLDQRTSECSWPLVQHLSELKTASEESHKVEIFYFLAQGWLNRAILSRTSGEKLLETSQWWGDDEWKEFLDLPEEQRPIRFCEKFKELGYNFCQSYGMRAKDGRVMFWMIHATDHPRAPKIMENAYSAVCKGLTDEEWKSLQEEFEW